MFELTTAGMYGLCVVSRGMRLGGLGSLASMCTGCSPTTATHDECAAGVDPGAAHQPAGLLLVVAGGGAGSVQQLVRWGQNCMAALAWPACLATRPARPLIGFGVPAGATFQLLPAALIQMLQG